MPPLPPVLRNNTRFVFIPHADLVFFLLSSGEYDELAGGQEGEGRACGWEEGERGGSAGEERKGRCEACRKGGHAGGEAWR